MEADTVNIKCEDGSVETISLYPNGETKITDDKYDSDRTESPDVENQISHETDTSETLSNYSLETGNVTEKVVENHKIGNNKKRNRKQTIPKRVLKTDALIDSNTENKNNANEIIDDVFDTSCVKVEESDKCKNEALNNSEFAHESEIGRMLRLPRINFVGNSVDDFSEYSQIKYTRNTFDSDRINSDTNVDNGVDNNLEECNKNNDNNTHNKFIIETDICEGQIKEEYLQSDLDDNANEKYNFESDNFHEYNYAYNTNDIDYTQKEEDITDFLQFQLKPENMDDDMSTLSSRQHNKNSDDEFTPSSRELSDSDTADADYHPTNRKKVCKRRKTSPKKKQTSTLLSESTRSKLIDSLSRKSNVSLNRKSKLLNETTKPTKRKCNDQVLQMISEYPNYVTMTKTSPNVTMTQNCPDVTVDSDVPSSVNLITQIQSQVSQGMKKARWHPTEVVHIHRCTECSFICTDQTKLQTHLSTTHGPNCKPARDATTDVVCSSTTAGGMVIYRCKECTFISTTSSELRSHMICKHPIKAPQYKCMTCDFSSTDISITKTHQMSHSTVKQYTCTVCRFQSIYPSDVIDHMAMHIAAGDAKKPQNSGIFTETETSISSCIPVPTDKFANIPSASTVQGLTVKDRFANISAALAGQGLTVNEKLANIPAALAGQELTVNEKFVNIPAALASQGLTVNDKFANIRAALASRELTMNDKFANIPAVSPALGLMMNQNDLKPDPELISDRKFDKNEMSSQECLMLDKTFMTSDDLAADKKMLLKVLMEDNTIPNEIKLRVLSECKNDDVNKTFASKLLSECENPPETTLPGTSLRKILPRNTPPPPVDLVIKRKHRKSEKNVSNALNESDNIALTKKPRTKSGKTIRSILQKLNKNPKLNPSNPNDVQLDKSNIFDRAQMPALAKSNMAADVPPLDNNLSTASTKSMAAHISQFKKIVAAYTEKNKMNSYISDSVSKMTGTDITGGKSVESNAVEINDDAEFVVDTKPCVIDGKIVIENKSKSAKNLMSHSSQSSKIRATTKNTHTSVDGVSKRKKYVSNGKTFECRICNARFPSRDYSSHVISHAKKITPDHEIAQQKFDILTTDASSEQKLELFNNLLIQNEIFQCQSCSFTTKSLSSLQTHCLTAHDIDLGPFSCSICKAKYDLRDDLKKHVSDVHKLKNHRRSRRYHLYACRHCEYTADSYPVLKDHRNTYHKGELYKCEKCDYESASYDRLKSHLKLHSSGEIEISGLPGCRGIYKPSELRYKRAANPLTNSPSNSLSNSFTNPLTNPLSKPLSNPLSNTVSHSLSNSFTNPLTNPLGKPLSNPLSNTVSHSLSNSLSHSFSSQVPNPANPTKPPTNPPTKPTLYNLLSRVNLSSVSNNQPPITNKPPTSQVLKSTVTTSDAQTNYGILNNRNIIVMNPSDNNILNFLDNAALQIQSNLGINLSLDD